MKGESVIPSVDLRAQYHSIKADIDAAIGAVMESGQFILGEQVEAFEREFADYCGVKHGVGVACGTDALQLALMAYGVGAGDEVITVPNTSIFTALAISATGAKPVFVDIDLATYTMDAALIPAAITKRTKAIIPVHLYGQPADMDAICEIAKRYGLVVIEDACQAHGATYKGRKVGSLGDAAAFSFYPTKNLGAYGDGGMVVTDDNSIAAIVSLLRRGVPVIRWDRTDIPVNSRLDELQAAILRAKLPYLDGWNCQRLIVAGDYYRLLFGVTTPWARDTGHVYHQYVIRAEKRNELKAYLEKYEVTTQIHYAVPLHWNVAYQDRGASFPNAEAASREVLSLPMYPELTLAQVVDVAAKVGAFYE